MGGHGGRRSEVRVTADFGLKIEGKARAILGRGTTRRREPQSTNHLSGLSLGVVSRSLACEDLQRILRKPGVAGLLSHSQDCLVQQFEPLRITRTNSTPYCTVLQPASTPSTAPPISSIPTLCYGTATEHGRRAPNLHHEISVRLRANYSVLQLSTKWPRYRIAETFAGTRTRRPRTVYGYSVRSSWSTATGARLLVCRKTMNVVILSFKSSSHCFMTCCSNILPSCGFSSPCGYHCAI